MFRDRRQAGELLATRLAGYRGRPNTLLLALPRGGVPVAVAMAHTLALPVDILPVRKIGAPAQPELAVGAIAADGLLVLDEDAIAAMDISAEVLESAIAAERAELLRREREYRGEKLPPTLAGQNVILVDDGIATGYTMLAATRSVRQQGASRVVIAVPVAPREVLDRLRAEGADEVVCLSTPPRLLAVGGFYDDFSQISDEQVREELAKSGSDFPEA